MKKNSVKATRLSADKRREALLHAAAEIFLEQGFEAAKINDIIAKAGGSKRAIYTEFGGKDELFLALIKEKADSLVSPLAPDSGSQEDLRNALLRFAEHVLQLILAPEGIGIMQCVMAASGRFPELARIYFASGPGRATDELAHVLERARENGELTCTDSRLAAGAFMGMLRGNLHLETLLRVRSLPDASEIKRLAEVTVEIFLNGMRPR